MIYLPTIGTEKSTIGMDIKEYLNILNPLREWETKPITNEKSNLDYGTATPEQNRDND